jgi:hypothetical protein
MTVAAAASRPRHSERPLFLAAALAVALVVFTGFARTFYLKGFFGSPALSGLLLLHGLAMTLWIGMFIAQIGLVAAGRRDLHRRLGLLGAGLVGFIIVVNFLAAVDAGRRGFSPTPQVTPIMFMAVPLVDLLVFAILVGAALWQRRHSATHKRLMLLATLGIVTPAVARLPIDALKQAGLPAFFAVTVFCLLTVVILDTVRNRRLHPAFGWGGALLIGSIPGRILLSQTEAWGVFARWLIA